MAVKKTSGSGQILVSVNGTTYMPVLRSSVGDLQQQYESYNSESGEATGIRPDFAQVQPVLELTITDASQAGGLARPNGVDWYFNDTKLEFGADNISTTQLNGETGQFKRVNGSANSNFRLQAVKNLVRAAMGTSAVIKAIATVPQDATSVKIPAQAVVKITKGTASAGLVSIGYASGSALYIDNTNKSVKLVCLLNMATPPSGYTYQWAKLNAASGKFENIAANAGGTAQTLTVTEAMVDSNAVFRCTLSQGGNAVGSDSEVVSDLSDPYVLFANPSITAFTKPADVCDFSPKVRRQGSETDETGWAFSYAYYDPAGNTIAAQDTSKPNRINYAMAKQAGNAINYVIEGSKNG